MLAQQPVPSYFVNPHLFTDRDRCPACLSWSSFAYPGNEFTGCNNCKTIAARDRRTTAIYDAAYVAARYDRYKTTRTMSHLRLAVMEGVLHLYESLGKGYGAVKKGMLCDVGFGNGDFIRTAHQSGWDAEGNDVNPTEYEGVRRVTLPNKPEWPVHYRVITFFDSLEHFPDLLEARWVSHAADWLLLSFPAVPETFPYDLNWRHHRPGEHMMHFNPKGLEKIFSHDGVKCELVYQGTPEDHIRTRWNWDLPNVWTVALRCRNG